MLLRFEKNVGVYFEIITSVFFRISCYLLIL